MNDNIQKENKGMQFLKVPYEYFNLIGTHTADNNKIKIDALDVLIVSKIVEFIEFGMSCFISDDGLANLFHVSRSTVQRSIKKLKSLNWIISETYMTHDTGQQTKHRNLTVNNKVINTIIDNNKQASLNYSTSKRQNNHKVASNNSQASINVEAITEKENKNNIKIKENNYLSSIPDGIKDLMNKIGINYQKNTDDELRKIIGETFEYRVLERLIEDNKTSFLKNVNNGQNYLFGILKTLIKTQYKRYQTKIWSGRTEYKTEVKRMQSEPYIDYKRIALSSNINKNNKNTIDVAALLDEMDADCEDDLGINNNTENNTEDVWEDSETLYHIDEEGNKIFSSPSLKMLHDLKNVSVDEFGA
jgi:predicted transcriptional regulator